MIIAGHAHLRPNDTVAAVLSLVIPGAGQIYKGRIAMGIAWLVLTVLGYLTLLVPGMLLHFICVFQACGMEPSIGRSDSRPTPRRDSSSVPGVIESVTAVPVISRAPRLNEMYWNPHCTSTTSRL